MSLMSMDSTCTPQPAATVLNDLANALGYLFPALDDILEDASSNNMTQSGLSSLNEGLAHVGDAESSLVGGQDVVVDD